MMTWLRENWRLYNNIHEKILNSDWLRKECSSSVTRVQTSNTSAKLVTREQITNGFWLAENTKETKKNQSDFSCFNNKI